MQPLTGNANRTSLTIAQPSTGHTPNTLQGSFQGLPALKMPCLIVVTNVTATKEQEMAFLKEASAATAATLGKPEAYVTVRVQSGVSLLFGGSDAPAAQCDVFCIGKLDQAMNHTCSSTLALLLQSHFGVPGDRHYINFQLMERHEVGYNGSTFAGPPQ